MEYTAGIDTAVVSLYLIYYFKVSNKVVSTKIISAHRAYHSINRRRRANVKIRSNSFKVNDAAVSTLDTRLIDHYRAHMTSPKLGRSKLKEEIQGAKVGSVGSMS